MSNIIIETERLLFRPFTVSDIDNLAEIYSNPHVMRFIGTGVTYSRSQTEKSINNWIAYQAKHGFSNWALIRKEDEAFLGKCGLSRLPDNSDIEVSYLLNEPYWGMGFATEASKAAVEYGFNKLKMTKIAALVYPQNSPSIRVLEKTGMKYVKETEYWNVKFLFYEIKNETR